MQRILIHKFHAKQTEIDGIKFASKKESKYYQNLKIRQKAGDILFFLRQVPLHLPGNIIYRCDFLEFHKNGIVEFVECKGFKTEGYKIKKRLVESTYPIKIKEV